MRCIHKSAKEPEAILMYRKTAGKDAYWDGFSEKDAIRDQLLQDQGHLCCYCMRRIDKSNILDTFVSYMMKKYGRQGSWPSSKIQKELNQLSEGYPLKEFCGMLEWWLKKKLKSNRTKTTSA